MNEIIKSMNASMTSDPEREIIHTVSIGLGFVLERFLLEAFGNTRFHVEWKCSGGAIWRKYLVGPFFTLRASFQSWR